MKTLCGIGLVLLLAGEAGAGEPRPIDRTPLTGKEKIPLSVLMAGEEAPNPLVCLAKMEAAMRAMEPFTVMPNTFQWVFTGSQDILQINRPPNQRKPLVDAIMQWGVGKNCWRTP